MSILYRAIWSADTKVQPDAIERVIYCAAAWAQETAEPEPLPEGWSDFELSRGRRRRTHYRPVRDGAFELTVNDKSPGDAAEWTTVIRSVAIDSVLHTLVENRMESEDLALRVSVGRPKVVHELLVSASNPTLGSSALLTGPEAIPAAGIRILTEFLADDGRALPVIVCTEPAGHHDQSWLVWANRIASRVEGIAVVVTLEADAVTAFRAELGELAVWAGGIRVYSPVPVTRDADGWRHRYYLHSRLEAANQATIDRIVYSVAQLSTRRRVPEAFDIFDEQSTSLWEPLGKMIPAADLEAAREVWAQDLDIALAEQSELERQLAKATGHLARLKDELISRGLSDIVWGTQYEDMTSVPDVVQDTSDAVLAAQAYLSEWLALPGTAARELHDIDTAPNAFAWGNTTWRGLRSLAAYAEDRSNGWDRGGFWEWCAKGSLLGWPATSKKLSMSEGETVQNNEKLSRTRVFEVDTAVHASGQITMLAHLKIAEGGGNLAPRVYFHDDTGGATGKVHVGFVGPHYLVPNRSTN